MRFGSSSSNPLTAKRLAKLPKGCKLDGPTLDWMLDRLGAIAAAVHVIDEELRIAHDPCYTASMGVILGPEDCSPRDRSRKERARVAHAREVQKQEGVAWAAIEAKAAQTGKPPKGWRIETVSDGWGPTGKSQRLVRVRRKPKAKARRSCR